MEKVVALADHRPRRGWFGRRRSNHRPEVQSRGLMLVVAGGLAALGRTLFAVLTFTGKVVAVVGLLGGAIWGTRWATNHVLVSPRFAVSQILISPTIHVSREEILELSGVAQGDRLLGVDPDEIAAAVATHSWVASARVQRRLPSTLSIDVVERRAVGVAVLGGLYLLDEKGQPFKRATLDEAEGLPVVTGIDRQQYVDLKDASEGVFREALALAARYSAKAGRPRLSEVHADLHFGYSLFLVEGGAEIRLGRSDFDKKLASLDQIFEAVATDGHRQSGGLRIVHLDVVGRARVPVLLGEANADEASQLPE